ncbi:MAG: organomercurial lyase [Dehalococcoidia bacterium]
MTDLPLVAALYHVILEHFVRDGQAPHYLELGQELGLAPAPARQTLHDLMGLGLPNYLYPGTDLIVGFAPFSNLPNQYRVSVAGSQRWYAECGFEALAISWLFPGQEVAIACPCLDCGASIEVRMRDGALLALDPPTAVGHTALPPARWREDWGRT